jgi:hypothetical protein
MVHSRTAIKNYYKNSGVMCLVSHAALCELVNQKRINVHLHHLTRIAAALDIDDMNQIITFEEKIED